MLIKAKNILMGQTGQQVLEHGLFIVAISAALLVMFPYMKRGLQAVIRHQADQFARQQDSYPLASTASQEFSNTSASTQGTSRTQRFSGTGGARYEFSAASSSSGAFNASTEETVAWEY